ncbi:MAG TPA: glycosyltransferase family 4 protein [Tepidisphaeraceae bacterium]|jgi:glycosyltransferase involved in cell wall biosynthesis|nr:glycosyltransferase family 4 protein [Tepidisphaeraceae bacterium]
MRLTLINQFYTPDISPTAHLCASLAEHRAAQGDQVTVITSRTGYVTAVDAARADGAVRVCRVLSTRLGSRTNLRRFLDWATFYFPAFWRAATLPRQDVIIALTTPPFIALAGALHKFLHPGTKLVLWNMDCYPEAVERTGLIRTGGFIARTMRAVNRAIFRRADRVVCLDGAMKQLLSSQYTPRGGDAAFAVIPNWERKALFPDSPCDDPPAARAPGTKFTILYLGNAGYGHEFATMIAAAQTLRDEPVNFVFVGGGALRQWIAGEKERLGLGNIELRDYISKEQTPELMRSADCALITLENPMLGVMSPSKLHANLAMGLPILYVGPAGGNVDEAITRFACGASLRPGAAQELVETIRNWMSDCSAHARLRQSARRAFDEAYCDLKALKQFDALLGGS